jgi:hypothetical protein
VDDENEDAGERYDPDDPEQRRKLFRVRVEERSRPILYTLDADGNLTFLNQPDDIRAVLREHVSRLARQLEARNVPRYDRKPESWEWSLCPALARSLPGARKPCQSTKHFAIALGRLLQAQGSGIINLEMGGGKTTIALAVAEYLNAAHARTGSQKRAYPVLVVGPGIVTGEENWPQEVREVIPGAVAKVVEIAARPLPNQPREGLAKAVEFTWMNRFGLFRQATWLDLVEAAQKQNVLLSKAAFCAVDTLNRAEKTCMRMERRKQNSCWTPHQWLPLVKLGRFTRDPVTGESTALQPGAVHPE